VVALWGLSVRDSYSSLHVGTCGVGVDRALQAVGLGLTVRYSQCLLPMTLELGGEEFPLRPVRIEAPKGTVAPWL